MAGAAKLPARYEEPWTALFHERIASVMAPGTSVLDVGSGRSPCVPRAARPAGVVYVGLDVSAQELEQAGPDAFDEVVVLDVGRHMPALDGRFDLVCSWQALEHVSDLDAAVLNLHSYLRPGGRLVAQLSGRYAAFAVIARLVPHKIGARAMGLLLGVDPGTRFPTHYDHCTASGLKQAFAGWTGVEVLPRYRGASYFSFLRPLQVGYVAYEDWTLRSGRRNLATHYLVDATR